MQSHMILILSIALTCLSVYTVYLYRVNLSNYRTAVQQQEYLNMTDTEIDILHERVKILRREIQADERVMRDQIDRINNLQQANIQMMYLLDPRSVPAITSEYQA